MSILGPSTRQQKSLPLIADSRLAAWSSLLRPLITRALPPPPPQNFRLTNARGGLSLTWSPVQRTSVHHGPDGYEILRSLDGTFTGDVQHIPVKNIAQTSYFDAFSTPTVAHYRILCTAGSNSNPQSARGPHSGALSHLSLDPSDTASTPTTRLDTYADNHVRSTARFGNYGLEVYQGNPAVNGNLTVGAGGVSAGGSSGSSASVSFSGISGGVNSAQALQVGDSSILSPVGTGVVAANQLNGTPVLVSSPADKDILAYSSADGQFENKTAAALGLASAKIAAVDLTAQSAAISATTLFAITSSGRYRISWCASVTTVDAVSSALGGTNGFQVLYTDADDSVVKTSPRTITSGVNTDSTNTTATAISGVVIANAKAGTNLQYKMDYTSNTPGQMIFNLHIILEAL